MNTIMAQMPEGGWFLILLGLGLVVAIVLLSIILKFLSIWIRALFSGARVTYVELMALWLRKVPVGYIVDNRITAMKAGLEVTIDDLSTHYLAGGNVEMVIL